MRISRVELLVVLWVVVSGAYFNGGASWNQNARLDAIYAFVEPGTPDTGTFRIDRFLPAPKRGVNTGDWARVGEHYYANKAPGTILLGVLAYGPLHYLQLWLGTPVEHPLVQIFDAYLINVMVSVVWLGVAALAFFRLLRSATTELTALSLTLALFLGTALLPFSTQLWGHTTAAAFVLLGFVAFHEPTRRAALWAGFWLMAAVCCDYLTVIPALAIAAHALARRPRHVPALACGALPLLVILLGYQWYCFGSPWTLATTHSNPIFMDQTRALGMFGTFDPRALFGLTFSVYRGMFLHMPVLLLAPVGFYHWLRRAPRDPWLWTCLGTLLAGLVAVASFNGWHGGANACTRYLLGFFPPAFLAAREIPWTRWRVGVAAALTALSAFNMLAVAAVNPVVPDRHPNPVYGLTYQLFFAGDMAPYAYGIRLHPYSVAWPDFADWAMWNWGELLGLRGLWSLLPLLLIWAALSIGLRRALGADVQ